MQTIPPRVRGLLLASLLASLTACSTTCPDVKTETVEVYVPRAVALPPALVTAAPEPNVPARACVDADGAPTLCGAALADWIIELRAWGRGLASQLGEIAGLQPEVE